MNDRLHPNKSFQFIFKPALDCNLACRYCYAKEMRCDASPRMSLTEAKAAFDWVFQFCDYYGIRKTSILWQGGEPLLPGPSFMKEILEYYEKGFQDRKITNSNIIQTNLLLFNKDFIPLIHSYFDHAIGFSFDYMSDTRCFPDGSNANEAIWRKVETLSNYNLKLSCICQITNSNVNNMESLYHHFKACGIDFKISQIFPSQSNENGETEVLPAELTAAAVCRLFDIWLNDPNPTIDITNLKNIMLAFIRGFSTECCRKEDCSTLLLSLVPGGRIFPCARYADRNDIIGNYYTDAPAKVMNNRQILSGLSQKDETNCKRCQFLKICHGGCTYNRMVGWGREECLSNQIILSHIYNQLKKHGILK